MALDIPKRPKFTKESQEAEVFPDKPIPLSEVEQLDGEECLRLIEARHHLGRESLLVGSEHAAEDPKVKWDTYYLWKLALMQLECVPVTVIADFFTDEFSKLERRDEFVSKNLVLVTGGRYFSDQLKKRIRACKQYTRWKKSQMHPGDNPRPEEI